MREAFGLHRHGILSDLRWRASQITIANGYALEVKGVGSFYRGVDDVGPNDRPYVSIFPAQAAPPPQHFPAGQIHDFLDVAVVCVVDADSPDERSIITSQLEEYLFFEWMKDPTRGGWAYDSEKHTFSRDELGLETRSVARRNAAPSGLVAGLRAKYFRGEVTDQVLRTVDIHQLSADSTTIAAGGTFVKMANTWQAGELVSGFTAQASGDLTYIRQRALYFRLAAALSISVPSAGVLSAQFNVGGASLARSRIDVSNADGETVHINLDAISNLSLNTVVYVELTHTVPQDLTPVRSVVAINAVPLV